MSNMCHPRPSCQCSITFCYMLLHYITYQMYHYIMFYHVKFILHCVVLCITFCVTCYFIILHTKCIITLCSTMPSLYYTVSYHVVMLVGYFLPCNHACQYMGSFVVMFLYYCVLPCQHVITICSIFHFVITHRVTIYHHIKSN